MKLGKEEIQFIDTYLSNSDVRYVDIRMEMIDHIATGVEHLMETDSSAFKDTFKNYMLIHKKEILRNNKTRWSSSGEIIKRFLLFLVRPPLLVLGILLFLLFNKIDVRRYFSVSFPFRDFIFLMIFAIFFLQRIYFYVYLKKRFYRIERIGTLLTLIYYLQWCFFPVRGLKENGSVVTITIFSYVLIGYLLFFFREIKKFNNHRLNYI
jgi:hypothetical protein